MKTKLVCFLALLTSLFFCDFSLAAQEDQIGDRGLINRHPGWRLAAISWSMDLQSYVEEADRVLTSLQESGQPVGYDDLVSVLNPYANLAPQIEANLIGSLGGIDAYRAWRVEEERKQPKFTIGR